MSVDEVWNTTQISNYNGTTEGSPTDNIFESYPKGLLEFAAACCILFIVLGVPGNLVTVAALLRSPRLRRNATTAFIVNLCIADGFFCASSLPFAVSTFLLKKWVHGRTLCVLFPMFRYSNVALSLLTVAAITINRYISICHPKYYHRIFKRWSIALMILSLWGFALALLLPTLLEVWGRFGYDPAIGTCTILNHNGSPKNMIYILAISIPGSLFLFCYIRILLTVRRAERNLNKRTASSASDVSNTIVRTNAISRNVDGKSNAKDLRLVKIFLVIFCTFLAGFVPVSVVKLFQKEDSLPVLNIFGYLGVFITACTNPVIYVLMSAEYRQAYKNLFKCNK